MITNESYGTKLTKSVPLYTMQPSAYLLALYHSIFFLSWAL